MRAGEFREGRRQARHMRGSVTAMIAATLIESTLRMVVNIGYCFFGKVERMPVKCPGTAIPKHREDDEECK